MKSHLISTDDLLHLVMLASGHPDGGGEKALAILRRTTEEGLAGEDPIKETIEQQREREFGEAEDDRFDLDSDKLAKPE